MYGPRSNRVHFEPTTPGVPEIHLRRTRSVNQGSRQPRSRTRSAERVHTLWDENPVDMHGRDRNPSREAYDQLFRENHILKLQVRDLEEDVHKERTYNQELRRSIESNSDSEARKSSKLKEARKKTALLEVENSNLTTKIRELTRQLKDALEAKARYVGTEYEAMKSQVTDWRRRYEDANRRIDRMRDNLDEHISTNRALQAEVETLRRENERLRRRHS
ncbi:hypothetical protein QBC40DRAFT_1642 [Triangularia verruculosa]|uniref:Uncharacterized protein n=1 Tax=Triangularia verruculosa TaxID=2587418 RepID=A0AAN6XWB2_9PEZI|nr:hypothetical protein QBC40DRAFT_1642 [Triangularia verruculosa]